MDYEVLTQVSSCIWPPLKKYMYQYMIYRENTYLWNQI